jgi:hypothetical protein
MELSNKEGTEISSIMIQAASLGFANPMKTLSSSIFSYSFLSS